MVGGHEIELSEFKQSGYTHHFGVISLGIADAICRVPALSASTNTLEICRRTIQEDVTDEYQRDLLNLRELRILASIFHQSQRL